MSSFDWRSARDCFVRQYRRIRPVMESLCVALERAAATAVEMMVCWFEPPEQICDDERRLAVDDGLPLIITGGDDGAEPMTGAAGWSTR